MDRPCTSHVLPERNTLSTIWRPRTAVTGHPEAGTPASKRTHATAAAMSSVSVSLRSKAIGSSRSASHGEESQESPDFQIPLAARKSFSGLGTALDEVRSLRRNASKRSSKLSGLFKHKSRESLHERCQEQGKQQSKHTRSPTWFERAANTTFRRGRRPTIDLLRAPNDTAVPSPDRAFSVGAQETETSPFAFPRPGDAARAAAAASNEISESARSPLPRELAKLRELKITNDSESGIGIDMRDTIEESACIDSSVTRRDPADLPQELFFHIVTYLDAQSIMNSELVSRQWHQTANSYCVWRSIFGTEFRRRASISQETTPVGGLGIGKKLPVQDWKKMWKVRKALDARWRDGHAAAVYLEGHGDSVYCVQFDEKKIVTGSRDRTIRVWDVKTLECIKIIGVPKVGGLNSMSAIGGRMNRQKPFTSVHSPKPINQLEPLRGRINHHGSILCLQFDATTMVTGSSDWTLIVWDITQDYRPTRRLRAHRAGVLDVCFDETHIVSCSKDANICLWNRATGALLRTFTGHRGPVNAVQLRGEHVVSASGDGLAKLWNLSSGTCVKEFRSRDRGLACVEFSPDSRIILAGGNDQVVYQFDANTGELVRELAGHGNLVRSLHLDSVNARVISGSYDYSVKAFSLDDGRLLCDFAGWTTSWMLSAKADYRRIVATSQDGRVVIMDFGYGLDGIDLLEG